MLAVLLNVGLSPAGSSLVGDSGASVPGSVTEPGAAEGAWDIVGGLDDGAIPLLVVGGGDMLDCVGAVAVAVAGAGGGGGVTEGVDGDLDGGEEVFVPSMPWGMMAVLIWRIDML